MRGDILKGHLDMLLLAVVAAGPIHGYAIIAALCCRSGGVFDLPEGTVYPALHRLERSRMLTSRWAPGSGRRRRVYELTAEGHRALHSEREAWSEFAYRVSAVLGTLP
jgi:DNA-binding PadR family transcriptional regulator